MKSGDLRIIVVDSQNYSLEIARVTGLRQGQATERTGTLQWDRLGYWSNLESLCRSAIRNYPRWSMASDIQKAIDEGVRKTIQAVSNTFPEGDPLLILRERFDQEAERRSTGLKKFRGS